MKAKVKVRVKHHWLNFPSPFFISEAFRIDRTSSWVELDHWMSAPKS